ncbi:hypothetical protein [Aeromonas simiae]|uniref:hypothetical protein n=1 Tax=Aeromonas simiae TaxID=218936 RepID=UPI00266CC2C5|nr:hypothetical protein [Aeromonas simiae]MDO2950343.1 hypothetical protein [Aeromonas simiae]MDO2954022.1 hypothetical protein [Aeromonas simiae]MDO2957765.1 hypothetical protein [Aeromonas simiae]
MKKYFIFTLIFMLSTSFSHAEDVGVDYRCFVSTDSKIKMRIMWVSTSGWIGGYVQYGKHKEKIPIVQTRYKEEATDENSPYAVTSDWIEIIDGKINGGYHFGYQGANFSDVFYINKNGRKFTFSQALESYDDCF